VPKGSNAVGFRNARADALIEQLRLTLDRGARTELLRAFHRIVNEEQPYTFVYVPKIPYCHRNTIKNVTYAKERPSADFQLWWSEQADG
jgi:peptide/nickel transport system substrate-binding protein